MTQNEWTELKFDRLNRITGVSSEKLVDKKICVYINEEAFSYYSNQVMTIVAVTILSKWCNNISVNVSDKLLFTHTHNKGQLLSAVLKRIVEDNDTFNNIGFNDSNFKPDCILSIGRLEFNSAIPVIYINSNGWIAGYGKNSFEVIGKTEDLNPIGASFSACLGNAALFKELMSIEQEETFWNMFDLHSNKKIASTSSYADIPFPDKLNIGNIVQIGCGAVGSSFDFILSLTNITGKLDLIDFDHVSIENLISSLTFLENDAKKQALKIDACERILKESKLNIYKHEGDYSSYIDAINYYNQYPDLILCLANERNIWSSIQHNYPPTVLHGTTTASWGLNVGRHFPLYDGCIVCRFGINSNNYVPICGSAVVEKQNEISEEKLGVLPFLSPATAVLIFAELIKLNMESVNLTKNFSEFSMKASVSADFVNSFFARRPTCPICTQQDSSLHYQLNSKSKYANLSPLIT